MVSVIIAAAAAFISTNIDDIIVLTVLYAEASTAKQRAVITAGQYLGLTLITAVSMLGSAGLSLLPQIYTRLLGIIPVLLGIKAWFDAKKTAAGDKDADSAGGISLFSVTALTAADGGDNLGVYIPLFTGSSRMQLAVTAAVFAVMAALLCLTAYLIADRSAVKTAIRRYSRYIIPAVFILIGLAVIFR